MISQAPQENLATKLNFIWNKPSTITEQALYDLFVLTNISNETSTVSSDSIFAADMPELLSSGKKLLESAALSLFEQSIIQIQDNVLLQKLAQKILESSDSSQIKKVFTTLKASSCTKLAWVNTEFSKQYNAHLLETLTLDEVEWLSIVIDAGKYIAQIGKQEHKLTAPLPTSTHFENINRILTSAQANPEIRAYLNSEIKHKLTSLSTPEVDYLREAEELVELVSETQLRAEFYPFAQSHMTWIKGHAATIGQAFASVDPAFLGWALVALSTGTSEYDNYKPSSAEYAQLQSWVKTYGRGYLIDTLDQYLSKRTITAPHNAVSQYYDNAVQSLDLNSKRWLLLELAFKNFPQIDETGIKEPAKEQLALCKKLSDTTYGCASLWRNLQEKLIRDLGPQMKETLPIIPGALFAIASQLPDEARLWLYLVIMTNTKSQIFDLTNVHYHERLSDTAIRQTIISSVTDHFIFLASCSDMMRSIVKSALTQKDNAPDFDKKVKALSLYQKAFTENELKKLDDNAKHWLLYALCFNTTITKTTTLSHTLSISVPSGRLFDNANMMLSQAQASPEQRLMYVNHLVQGLSQSAQSSFDTIIQNFINITIDSLNKEEQGWLFLCLHQQDTGTQPADFNTQFAPPIEKLSSVSKVLYLLSLFPNKVTATTQYLKEKNGMLRYFEPTLLDSLSPVTNQYIEACEMANLSCMAEDQSTRFAFNLSSALPGPVKTWVAASLERGMVDPSFLFMMIARNKIPPHIVIPLLHNTTNLLLLALKWPSLKETIIEKFGGNKHAIRPITAINLNAMPLGDIGMSMLCEILSTQSDSLMAFSARQTGITDKGVLSFNQKLLGKAPLQIIDFGKNDISLQSLRMMLDNPLVRQSPEHMAALVSAILSDLQHPDVITYLASHLLLEDVLIDTVPARDSVSFFRNTELSSAFQKADFLLDLSATTPLIAEMLNAIAKNVPDIPKDTQLIHMALSHKNASILSAVLFHVIDNIENKSTTEWIKTCLESGEIHLPKIGSTAFQQLLGSTPKQSDIIQMVQAASLLLSLNQELRQKLYRGLGGKRDSFLPPIHSIKTQGYGLPEDLQALLYLGLESNLDTLQNLQFGAMGLSNQMVDKICQSAGTHLKLRNLALNGNTMTSNNIRSICEALQQGHIQSIDLSECAINPEMLNTVIHALLNSNVHHLSIQNPSEDTESSASQISDFAAKSIAQFLAQPKCPLVHLDLSHNRISALGLHYITAAITSNPDSKIEKLCLNNQTSMGDAFIKQVAALIVAPTQIKEIEINGHTAKKEALELLIPAISHNTRLQKLSIMPKQGPSPELDSKIEEVLRTIEQMIEQNTKLVDMTENFAQLDIPKSPSLDNSESNELIDDFSKQLVFSKTKAHSSEAVSLSECRVPQSERKTGSKLQ